MTEFKQLHKALQEEPGQRVEVSPGIRLFANYAKVDHQVAKGDNNEDVTLDVYLVSETGYSWYCLSVFSKLVK